jgi:hypothetical protein
MENKDRDRDRKELAKQVMQATDSLNKTMQAAGGVPFDYNSMVSITLFEFIWRMAAPNGIRFHFQKPMKEVDEVKALHKNEEEDF